jgi:hypothetical protein
MEGVWRNVIVGAGSTVSCSAASGHVATSAGFEKSRIVGVGPFFGEGRLCRSTTAYTHASSDRRAPCRRDETHRAPVRFRKLGASYVYDGAEMKSFPPAPAASLKGTLHFCREASIIRPAPGLKARPATTV